MTQKGYQVIKILPIKSKLVAAKKQLVLFAISVFNWVFTSVIQSPRYTNDYTFGISMISVNTY